MAYRLDMTEATKFPYLEPCRPALDASHPDIALDTNRCISPADGASGRLRMSMAKASLVMSAGEFTGVSL
jgi:hypothetical protein